MVRADVSVVMLTRDAEPGLARALESVRWAREVIALDAGSRDGTVDRLRAFGATVVHQDEDLIRAHSGNFDVARNPGLARAAGAWTLVLDADETVTPALAAELREVAASTARVACEIPRVNVFWGRPSRILGDDRQVRFFPTGTARYEGTRLDQPPHTDCPRRPLREPILHRQQGLLRRLRERTDQRAHAAAENGHLDGRSALGVFRDHLRWYAIERAAWREGPRGLALAALFAAYPALEAFKARRLVAHRTPAR